jgi:ABC-type nitrate/sulfonate/bicarbonate transport system substrate-binding protein
MPDNDMSEPPHCYEREVYGHPCEALSAANAEVERLEARIGNLLAELAEARAAANANAKTAGELARENRNLREALQLHKRDE